MTGMLCLLVSGCNNSGNSTAAKEQQETLFNELNRAAEKCVERGNLQIDWQYAGQQDLKCDGKELEEINVGPSRNITLYDFKMPTRRWKIKSVWPAATSTAIM